MRRPTTLLAVTIGAVIAMLAPAGALALGAPDYLRPLNLRVAGSEGWQTVNDFRLDWELSAPLAGTPPPTMVHYRIYDASGAVATPLIRVAWSGNELQHVQVPLGPGLYTAEVWLGGAAGEGPAATAMLRFDNGRPTAPALAGPAAWLGRGVAAAISVKPPTGQQPPSGIRGYAASVDRAGLGLPCSRPALCDEEEIDLPAAGGAIPLGVLPEGINFAHVATVSGSGVSSPPEHLVVRVDASPPQVELGDIPAGWANGPVRIAATATDRLSGMAAAGPAGPITALAVDGEAPTVSAGPVVETTVSGDGVHRIEFWARDAAGNSGDGKAGSAAPSAALVRIDTTAPEVSFAASQDRSEPERIEATVDDQLSGPSATRGSIEVRPAGSRRQFERIPTAVTAGKLVGRWDSEAYPPGSYEFRATGYDAAGNQGSGDRRAGGAPMVLANPLKAAALLRYGLGNRRLLRLPYGRRATISGQLRSASGRSLAGRPVELTESFGPGATPARRTITVVTGQDGAFLARLGRGPSRRVAARFPGDATLVSAAGPQLSLRVPSAVRIRSSAPTAAVGGRPIVFSGRVGCLGAAIPAGIAVELQFRLGGSPWREFRTVQSDRHGRFHYPYAFSDDDSRGVAFQFRAYVPRQRGWPYEPAPSRPVAVTGR